MDSLPLGANYTGIIYREGYLFKQSRTMRKYWKTRYFVLRADGLLYFRSKLDKDGPPLGVIPLTKLSIHLDNIDSKSKPKYCLRLASRHFYFKTFCLCCFSNEERNNWFTALLTVISEELVSTFTLNKYRTQRSLSLSSVDSGVSDDTSTRNTSPALTLSQDAEQSMPRTESCDIPLRRHVADTRILQTRRPSRSLGSLAELVNTQTLPPKKTKKLSLRGLRKAKAFSAVDAKAWKGSYIDLSSIGSS